MIKVRVRRDRPVLRALVWLSVGLLVWSMLSSAIGSTAGTLAVIGAMLGVGALVIVAVDRLAAWLPVPLSAVWFGLASVSLLVAALIL